MRLSIPLLMLVSVLFTGCETTSPNTSSTAASPPGQRMFERGHTLWFGSEFVLRDQRQAIRCFISSAEQGNVEAMLILGDFCERGRPPLVYPKASEAFEWYRRAALTGDTRGMAKLASAYADGMGTTKNPTECFRWVEKLAQANEPMALALMGEFFESGYGVAADKDKAVAFYERAVKSGNAAAAQRAETRLHPQVITLEPYQKLQVAALLFLGVIAMESMFGNGGAVIPNGNTGINYESLGRSINQRQRWEDEQRGRNADERPSAFEELMKPSPLWDKGY